MSRLFDRNYATLLPCLHERESEAHCVAELSFFRASSFAISVRFKVALTLFMRSRLVASICSCRFVAFKSVFPWLNIKLCLNEINYNGTFETCCGDYPINNSRGEFHLVVFREN